MKLTQVSVFMENIRGRLFDVCKLLGENQINIRALNVADTQDFGILRMVVNDAEKALQVLKAAGHTANRTEIVAVEVSDRPGGLAEILGILNAEDINVEYMYGFVEKSSEKALMVFRFVDTEKAVEVLKKYGIGMLKKDQIADL